MRLVMQQQISQNTRACAVRHRMKPQPPLCRKINDFRKLLPVLAEIGYIRPCAIRKAMTFQIIQQKHIAIFKQPRYQLPP